MGSSSDVVAEIACPDDACRRLKKRIPIRLMEVSSGHVIRCGRCGGQFRFNPSQINAFKRALSDYERAKDKLGDAREALLDGLSFTSRS